MMSQQTIDERMQAYEAACSGHDPKLNRSHQREVIYRVIAGTESHPTAETIYEQAQREVPSLSLGTVYKNLSVLIGLGLVREVHAVKGPVRYDANNRHHHHFVCEVCGQVMDLPADVLSEKPLAHPALKEFKITDVDILFHGRCNTCSGKKGKTP